MNSIRRHYLLICIVLNLLLAGCFGGKTQVIRSESQQRAESTLSRGVRAEQKGNYTEAEKLLTEALTASSSIEDNPLRTTVLINLARLCRLQKDLPKAEQYISRALALVATDSALFAEAAHEMALLELTKENPVMALDWSQKSIAAEQGNLRGSRRNLASRIQLTLGDWSAAGALARSALDENRSANQPEEEANSLRILGIVARNEKKYTEGERLLQEALSIDKRIGKSSKISADLEELAKTAHSAGKMKESAGYLERAFEVNLAAGRLRQAVLNQETLAGIYDMLGDPLKADKAGETARKIRSQVDSQQQHGSSVTINPSNKP